MKRITVELVPRSEEELRAELTLLKEERFRIDRINIPDLLRLELRSWEGATVAKDSISLLYANPRILRLLRPRCPLKRSNP